MPEYDIDTFLLSFFNDPNVNPHIRVLGTMDRWGTTSKITSIEKEKTAHTVTSLSFFDKLNERDDILRPTGETIKCFDTYHDSFLISDQLRKCLLMPEEPSYEAFSPTDRQEFIFHVFKALCLGGRLCQFEDFVEPYLECTKLIYKDLVSVTKNPTTGKLQVASQVYKIKNATTSVSPLFPIEHPQNFMYVSIDPVRRYVNVWYHASDTYY
ncbi:hypothetical protein HK097_001707 [Rhizophlyctis rosea]|uniref:Cilia- and flagella-associated protein 300 n=1 Tax=Rhizophlyctis rosea TaxID=64517 RepID=A0AAD5S6Y0_9FUNG|nr:hypothetical protein HK097_001707 [Rhizophlyctis rosea]